MAVPWTLPELASRFEPYVDELREFFASYGLHYGSAQDVGPIIQRLNAPGPFAQDFSSMVRSIILRRGGTIPRAELFEIIAVAIGGPHIDQSATQFQPSAHQLLGFLSGVAGKPWNEPPPEASPISQGKPLEFPTANANPDYVRPASVYSRWEHAEPDPQPLATPVPASEPAYVPEPEVADEPQAESQPAPEPVSNFAPIPEPDPPPITSPVPAFVLEPEVTDEPEAATQPAPEPVSNFAPIPEPDPPPISSPVPAYVPEPEVAYEPEPAAQPAPEPVQNFAPDPEADPRPHLPPDSRNESALPAAAISASPSRPLLSPRRVALIAGTVVVLVALGLVIFLHRTPSEPIVSGPVGSTAPNANDVPKAAPDATPAPISPAASSTGAPTPAPPRQHAGHSFASGEIIAPPYITPGPGQPNPVPTNAKPSAAIPRIDNGPNPTPSATTQPSVRPGDRGSGIVESSAANSAADQPVASQSAATLNRDASRAIAGRPINGRHPSVSYGVMAGNLISAPRPGYPMLARIAHIKGQVILQAVIAKDGSVSATHVLRGHRLLRGAAVDAVERWRFRPYMLDGRPVDVSTIVTVDFNNAN